MSPCCDNDLYFWKLMCLIAKTVLLMVGRKCPCMISCWQTPGCGWWVLLCSLLLVQRTGLPGVVGRMQWGQAMAVGLSSVTTTGRQSGQSSRELEFEHSPVPAWDSRAASQCPRLEHHGFAAELC